MGFEGDRGDGAVEIYRHCHSQTHHNKDAKVWLYGRSACKPAPFRIMAFRHALILLNGPWLRSLENVTSEESAAFGHCNGSDLCLCRDGLSIATMQLRWGQREEMHMPWHVLGQELLDGSHHVRVLEDRLSPGDVYLSSPACCLHSVDYDSQAYEETANQPPNTLTIQFRSDFLHSRYGPAVFHKSNKLFAATISPVI